MFIIIVSIIIAVFIYLCLKMVFTPAPEELKAGRPKIFITNPDGSVEELKLLKILDRRINEMV